MRVEVSMGLATRKPFTGWYQDEDDSEIEDEVGHFWNASDQIREYKLGEITCNLLQNNPTYTTLMLIGYDSSIHDPLSVSDCKAFLDAVRWNSTVQTVLVGCSFLDELVRSTRTFGKWSPKKALGLFWNAIARLPKLTILEIHKERSSQGEISLRHLECIFQHALQLQELHTFDLELVVLLPKQRELTSSDETQEQQQQQVANLERAIRNHPSLRALQWDFVTDFAFPLSAFFLCRNLKSLSLWGVFEWNEQIAQSSASDYSSSSNLETLHFRHCRMKTEGCWDAFATFLQDEKCRIKKLIVADDVEVIDDETCCRILSGLEGNHTIRHLELLRISQMGHESWNQIAQMLSLQQKEGDGKGRSSSSSALEILELVDCGGLSNTAGIAVAMALEGNRCLRRLSIQFSFPYEFGIENHLHESAYVALQKMLSMNNTLHEVEITPPYFGCPPSSSGSGIGVTSKFAVLREYYLNLNKHQLRNMHLNMNTVPTQFVHILQEIGKDVPLTYFVLRNNPSFAHLILSSLPNTCF